MQQYWGRDGNQPTPAQDRWITLSDHRNSLAEARRGYYSAEEIEKACRSVVEKHAHFGFGFWDMPSEVLALLTPKQMPRMADLDNEKERQGHAN